jgi:hypothetical protein
VRVRREKLRTEKLSGIVPALWVPRGMYHSDDFTQQTPGHFVSPPMGGIYVSDPHDEGQPWEVDASQRTSQSGSWGRAGPAYEGGGNVARAGTYAYPDNRHQATKEGFGPPMVPQYNPLMGAGRACSCHGGSPFGGSPFGGSPFGGSPFGGSPFGGSPFGGSPFGGSPFGGSPFGGWTGILLIILAVLLALTLGFNAGPAAPLVLVVSSPHPVATTSSPAK